MYTGHADPDGPNDWASVAGVLTEPNIPQYKRWDEDDIQTRIPGSVTWQILEPYVEDADGFI